jgi:hypothetical protein
MDQQTFLAVTSDGLRRAKNTSEGWQVDLLFSEDTVYALAHARSPHSVIYLGTRNSGVLCSAQDGRTWSRMGLTGITVKSLAVSPHNPQVIYAGVRPAGVYKSNDGGQSWNELEGFQRIRGRKFWRSPTDPTGYKEVGCATVTLYDQQAQRLQTIRYGRMPEAKKATLQQQLETEARSTLALNPTLQRVHLADGTRHNWFLLKEIEQHLPAPTQPPIEIVDYYHACDHLKEGCDAAWGESSVASKAHFERLKTLLKEAPDGAKRVIRALRYQRNKAKGNKHTRLQRELTYFCNQRHRMHYARYRALHLPIASGVMEVTCKTLVTQRFKRSGMAWTILGGQAILTIRSLVQSDRWSAAWKLLQTDFCKEVRILHKAPPLPNIAAGAPTSLGPSACQRLFLVLSHLPLAA